MTGNEDAVLRSQGLWNREYGGELGDNANRGLWRGVSMNCYARKICCLVHVDHVEIIGERRK